MSKQTWSQSCATSLPTRTATAITMCLGMRQQSLISITKRMRLDNVALGQQKEQKKFKSGLPATAPLALRNQILLSQLSATQCHVELISEALGRLRANLKDVLPTVHEWIFSTQYRCIHDLWQIGSHSVYVTNDRQSRPSHLESALALHLAMKQFSKTMHLDVLHIINLSRTSVTSMSPSLPRAAIQVMVSEREIVTCML